MSDASRAGGKSNGKVSVDTRLLNIGELAAMTGVSRRTIRYYEELGILPEPPRSAGGTRKYPEEYRFYVEGALALKQVGFNLDEVGLIGRLMLGAPLTATERAQAIAAISEKRQHLEHKIRVLNKMHELLEQEERRVAGTRGRRRKPLPMSSHSFEEFLAL